MLSTGIVNGYIAGVSTLFNFSAIFTGTFNVPAAGPVTFNFTSDDAFIFGIGGGAITNAWRARFPYGSGTACATAAEILEFAQQLYANRPEVLLWIQGQIGR